MKLSAFVFVLLFGAALPAVANVIVVDPGGGPGHDLLQAALDQAQPGDIVLVRSGDYSGPVPVLYQKGVVLVADTGQDVVLPGLRVMYLPAGQPLLLRGLEMTPAPGSTPYFLIDGFINSSVWIEDCHATGHDAVYDYPGHLSAANPALMIEVAGFAVIARGSFRGGRGIDATADPGGVTSYASAGAAGLDLLSTNLSLQGVQARGGDSGDGPDGPVPSAGGHALITRSSHPVVVHGGTFRGGDEGLGVTSMSGAGGYFINSEVWLRDATFISGDVQGDGYKPDPYIYQYGAVVGLPGAPRGLVLDSPVRESGVAGAHVSALPGDLAWLFLSAAPADAPFLKWQELFSLDRFQPTLPVLLGAVDAAGALDVVSVPGPLPAGTDGVVLYGQLGIITASGEPLLGMSSSMIWVSDAY